MYMEFNMLIFNKVDNMRVLHVNANDFEGGAARAAYRLHKGLLQKNIYSRLIVLNKKKDDFL